MFRKPKKKTNIRVKKDWDDINDEDTKVEVAVQQPSKSANLPIGNSGPSGASDDEDLVPKTPALLSFDCDEGADSEFTVKKSKKRAKELKRQLKLEEEAKEAEAERERALLEAEKESRKKAAERERQTKRTNVKQAEDNRRERDKYISKYMDQSRKVLSDDSDRDDDHDLQRFSGDEDTKKFSSLTVSGGIPDSRAVYEARKRRERLRREGAEGVIPLDDVQRLKTKGERDRLVREDENDESDEEHGKFYSSKTLLNSEEDARRENREKFLEEEQGDGERKEEMEEWEKQQILKAVGKHTIGRIRAECKSNAQLFMTRAEREQDENREPEQEDMDIEIDYSQHQRTAGPSTNGGEQKVDHVLAKLKLTIDGSEEYLNTLRTDVARVERNITENKETILKLELEAPQLATKFSMFQELRGYCRSLLDCLNEKVNEINDLSDKRRIVSKARIERLMRRRRRDIQDVYGECSAVSSGKNVNNVRVGDAGIRAADRESRRARRRRERQGTLTGISHEEGLSSDDEETTSQQLADQNTIAKIVSQLDTVFVDAMDNYSQYKNVLSRLMDWLAVDAKSFEDAYAQLCIPKLVSPYVRMQLIKADILNSSDFVLSGMSWYVDTLLAGEESSDIDREHPVLIGLLPLIVEKVLLPYLTDVIHDEWDPMSSKQCIRLAAVLNNLSVYPTLTPKSKPLINILTTIRTKFIDCITEDLFTPMFSKASLENPSTGCRAFLDRQYWSAVKLMRNVNAFHEFLSPAWRYELCVEHVVKVAVLGIQQLPNNDEACERKVRALLAELPVEFYDLGGPHSFRSLIFCLQKVQQEQKAAGRSFAATVKEVLTKIQ